MVVVVSYTIRNCQGVLTYVFRLSIAIALSRVLKVDFRIDQGTREVEMQQY